MLYRFTARRSACEVSIFLSVCLLKPLSVFNHAERGFFYGQIKKPSVQPAEQHIFISDIIMKENFRGFCSSAAERMPYKRVI